VASYPVILLAGPKGAAALRLMRERVARPDLEILFDEESC